MKKKKINEDVKVKMANGYEFPSYRLMVSYTIGVLFAFFFLIFSHANEP